MRNNRKKLLVAGAVSISVVAAASGVIITMLRAADLNDNRRSVRFTRRVVNAFFRWWAARTH